MGTDPIGTLGNPRTLPYWRDDYGIYSDWRHAFSSIDQFNVEFEFRRRDYPSGRLRERSRNIAELTTGWTRSLFGGTASFNLQAFGGREFATDDRPDGDSNFFGLSPTLSFTLTETLGGFVFGWWQHDRYNIERINVDAADNVLGIGEREDDWLCGTGCIRISPGKMVIDPVFLYYYLGDSQIIGWVANQAIGATLMARPRSFSSS